MKTIYNEPATNDLVWHNNSVYSVEKIEFNIGTTYTLIEVETLTPNREIVRLGIPDKSPE